MAGLLGDSWDDPRTAAVFAGLQGLLGGRNALTGLLGGGAAYTQTMAQAKQAAAAQEMQKLQMQHQQMLMAQAQQQMDAQQRQQDWLGGLKSPQQQAMQGALAGGGGPTLANAAKMPAVDQQQEMLFQAVKAGAMPVNSYLESMRKDESPITIKEGETLLNRKTLAPIYSAPGKEDDFVKNMRAAGIDPRSPQGAQLLQQWLQKQSTHQPGVSVSYGAPVAGVDAQGNPVFFQPDKTGGKPAIIPGVSPPKKELPASMQEKFATNAVTLNKIDKAIGLVDKNPDSLGLKNYLGDTVMQRLDPGGIELRAMVSDIGGQKIHDRSGAAVTVGESARLKPYIPSATDSPETVKRKLGLFRNEYAAMQQALNSGASIAQASAPQPSGGWSITPMGGN